MYPHLDRDSGRNISTRSSSSFAHLPLSCVLGEMILFWKVLLFGPQISRMKPAWVPKMLDQPLLWLYHVVFNSGSYVMTQEQRFWGRKIQSNLQGQLLSTTEYFIRQEYFQREEQQKSRFYIIDEGKGETEAITRQKSEYKAHIPRFGDLGRHGEKGWVGAERR